MHRVRRLAGGSLPKAGLQYTDGMARVGGQPCLTFVPSGNSHGRPPSAVRWVAAGGCPASQGPSTPVVPGGGNPGTFTGNAESSRTTFRLGTGHGNHGVARAPTGCALLENFARARQRWEDKHPQLAEDIRPRGAAHPRRPRAEVGAPLHQSVSGRGVAGLAGCERLCGPGSSQGANHAGDSQPDELSAQADSEGQAFEEDPGTDLGPVDRGERLFADARLSHDGWMSCQSCHTDGQSNGLLGRHPGRRRLRRAQAGHLAPGRRRDRPLDLARLGRPPGGPGPQVDRDHDAGPAADGRAGRRPDRLSPLAPAPPADRADGADEEAVGRGRADLPVEEVRRVPRPARVHRATRASTSAWSTRSGHRKFNPPSLRESATAPPTSTTAGPPPCPTSSSATATPGSPAGRTREVEDLVAFLRTL